MFGAGLLVGFKAAEDPASIVFAEEFSLVWEVVDLSFESAVFLYVLGIDSLP